MAVTFTRLGDAMATAAAGVSLDRPVDDGAAEALRQAVRDNLVVCVRGQTLDPAGFRDAMALFGTIMVPTESNIHPEVKEVQIISHDDRAKTGKVAGFHWHTDQSFRKAPAALTILYGVEVPATGADTQFTNMYAAYEALGRDMQRRLAGMQAVHRYRSTRSGTLARGLSEEEEAQLGEAMHPIVRTHPETGRKALYLNRNRMDRVEGLAHEESEALLDQLMAHATHEKFQYRHRWQAGDILVWDNRCTMHKANGDYPEGARRMIYRVMTQGSVPV
ncbi:MAG: TauD/TfdA dioxygenase family protein [Acetobacteraceae bacterium]